jgi:type I restriction enzyme R subunit
MNNPEFDLVEWPLVEQLKGLGWYHIAGDKWDPTDTERSSFREVILEGRLRAALRRINLTDEGEEWLDEGRISQAASALTKVGASSKLIEANQDATSLLLNGVVVPGVERWDQGKSHTVHYIDWNDPANNDVLVINQFRVDEPGGQAKTCIQPDAVLFVNGIPLVVLEAKAPGPEDAMAQAITQLRRYSNQRPDVEANEGNEELFWTNQLVIGTTFYEARAGTFTAEPEHFLEWKDTAPVSKEEAAEELGKRVEALSSQELLVAGMLRPARLLDIVRHFTVLMPVGPRTVKAVCRYQQYRAVHRAIERLKTGKTRTQDGEVDRRGGVIWHTQGSGKSLTMVFLVRVMRSDRDLRKFKVVAVTDRTDLQTQLSGTAELSGETVLIAKRAAHLRELLAEKGPGLVMAMIQKYRDDIATEPGLPEDESEGEGSAGLGVLNTDESILVLVDEAHRSHASTLHANLLAALPNAARIGFTGTPIIMGAKKKTHDIFGPFLDTYTLIQSEADGSTVPILYEGRTAESAVKGASKMDELFFRWFAGLTEEQREELQQKYANVSAILDAPELIAAKARDMLRHYVSTVMPQRLKAMVVANSRRACVRYRGAFLEARDEVVDELENLDSALAVLTGDEIDRLEPEDQFLVRALPHLDLLRQLDFVPVISGEHNDPADWQIWTDPTQQKQNIAKFKRALGSANGEADPTAVVIVKSMLLTGFDVPVAQVMYLDRLIQQAELLQAIARVNRTAESKDYGLVVDYYGVVDHLTEALAVYAKNDGTLDELAEGSLRSLEEGVGRLADRHARVRQLFVSQDIEPNDDPATMEACVELLEDPALRARFDVDLKKLLVSLDIVLPRPEARPYVADAKLFGRIQVQVRLRYRDQGDGSFNPSLYREKVRQLIDEHITVLDLTRKIEPMQITDVDFSAEVAGLPSDRAKASEMEHAARHHIRTHIDEDPARYKKLSERLDEILERLEGQWDQLVLELDGLIEVMKAPAPDDGTGFGTAERPFYGVLADRATALDGEEKTELVALTWKLVEDIRDHIDDVGFWGNTFKQEQLRKWIKVVLDESQLFESLALCDEVAAQLVDLARHNQQMLVPAA